MARSADADARRYEELKRAVAEIGLVRRGSLVKRFMPCGRPGCRCQADPPRLHGPYWQWTRKVRGKTETVRVQPEDASLMKRWIGNGRRLDRIVGDIERVSHRLTERLLRAARDSLRAADCPANRRGGGRPHETAIPTRRAP